MNIKKAFLIVGYAWIFVPYILGIYYAMAGNMMAAIYAMLMSTWWLLVVIFSDKR